MKFLKQSLKLAILAIFIFLANCKKETTTRKHSTASTIDSASQTESKKNNKKDSIQKPNLNKECFKQSIFELPYNQKIDIKKVKYETCDCTIEGIDELLCDSPNLRYISLPNFENRKVILVPMDCGDFNYRFYLATIFENKLLAKLYVEGEWYEPGDDAYKELTNFSIDKNYNITVTKKSLENGKNTATEVVKYTIDSDGTFAKE